MRPRSRLLLLLLATAGVAAAADPARGAVVLLVTRNNGSLTGQESQKQTQLQSWGYTVATLWDGANQSTYDAAVAAADVVYVNEEVDDADVGTKLRTASKGVVLEDARLDDAFGFSNSDGSESSGTTTTITNNSHAITSGLALGPLTTFSSNQPRIRLQGTLAGGLQQLASDGSGNAALAVIDIGGALANTLVSNNVAAGRRVRLPFGGDSLNFAQLNANGRALLQNALQWAAAGVPILHLKLNETSGTTANDSSTYDRDGTVTGTASWIAARRHNGFDFNGSTKIEVNSLLGNPGSFTVACWVRLDAADSSGAEAVSIGDYVVLRAHDGGAGVPQGRFFAGGSTWRTVAGPASLAGGGWRHLAVTFDDAANSLRLWIDGVNVATTSTTSSITWTGLGNRTRVGQHGNTNANFDLDGAVDDVRAYGRALTQGEIADLYGLVGQWKLVETSGATATDSSGKALNGTHTGGPTLAQSGPYPGAGQYAAAFDGTNDYVNGAAATNYSFADGFTIASWVNLDAYVNDAAVLENGGTTDSCSLSFSGTGQVRVRGRAAGGVQTLTTTATLPLRRWQHVVGAYDGAAYRVYVDGQLVSSQNNAFAVVAAAGNLTLAASLEGTDQFLDGRMHDVRLYNRAIAADEVAELYGLVGHWRFDEAAGSSLADSSGGGHAAAFNSGSPDWTTGAYASALEFDGLADDARTTAAVTPPSTGAVAFWMRSNGPPTSRQRPFGVGSDWEAWQDPDGIMRFDLCGDGFVGGFETVSAPATAGAWYHLVAMFDSTDDSYAIYVNGALDKSGTSTVNLTARPAAQLSFGTRTGSTERFAGRLDDFRVYNRKLSPWEVYQIFGLMAWYKLDEPSGTTALDATGRGNEGTHVGSPALGAASNGNAAMGTAIELSGADAIQIPGLYERSASVSAAAWVRLDAADSLGADVVSLGDHFKLTLRSGSPGALAAYYNGSTWVSVLGPQFTANAGWRHFAAVLRENDTLKLYVDGNEAASLALSGAISYAGLGANTRIGSHGNGGTSYDLDGRVDDVRIYNRAILPEEAFQLYRGTRIDGIRILQWVEMR